MHSAVLVGSRGYLSCRDLEKGIDFSILFFCLSLDSWESLGLSNTGIIVNFCNRIHLLEGPI